MAEENPKVPSTVALRGVRVNNLRGINLDLPLGKFICITGLSGSGKSSLAFDTLYAEGQRRYVESLSSYARQFLARMKKPDADSIIGIPPAIAFGQLKGGRGGRSTVGTSSEVYDYLRMLFARVGRNISPVSGKEVQRDTIESIASRIMSLPEGTRFLVLAPLSAEGRTQAELIEAKSRQGYTRMEVGGEIRPLAATNLAAEGEQPLLVVDRLQVSRERDALSRLRNAIETALSEGGGRMMVRTMPEKQLLAFSRHLEADNLRFEEPTDALFSFNSATGACPTCEGFGNITGIDPQLVVPYTYLSVYDGAILPWRGEKMSLWRAEFCRRAGGRGFPIFEPYRNLTEEQKDWLWHGDATEQALPRDEQVSIDAFFRFVERNQYKIQYRVMLSRYRGRTVCPTCNGRRLRREAEYVKLNGCSITDLSRMSLADLEAWFSNLQLPQNDALIARRLLTEINTRLRTLCRLGLGYLRLDRPTATLSGGETQRMHIARSIGSPLIGSLYILDEPSIGLHVRDTQRLLKVLRQLRDMGNTVVVVEHDEDIIRAADYIIDLGPRAGSLGGQIVYSGCFAANSEFRIQNSESGIPHSSLTLKYLTGQMAVPIFALPRRRWTESIRVEGAVENNLRNLDVVFPLGVMTVVTGVSGSGKSTLVTNILYRGLLTLKGEPTERAGEHRQITGAVDRLSRVVLVDQEALSRSSRSNPVTYVKAFDEIRRLLAQQPIARRMGMDASTFSFNSEEGRCPRCKGDGVLRVPMQFMADLTLVCDECGGKRFRKDVLEVTYKGCNVYDILCMTVDEAVDFFSDNGQEAIASRLRPLQSVGLGYLRLGQSSSTLSGGENQRLKLALYLDTQRTAPTLFIFDEPTRGLHLHDINILLRAFNNLIDAGHTIIIIEHNLEVIKNADHIIDLGPDGGADGGQIVAQGTPEQVVALGVGYTAKALRAKLKAPEAE